MSLSTFFASLFILYALCAGWGVEDVSGMVWSVRGYHTIPYHWHLTGSGSWQQSLSICATCQNPICCPVCVYVSREPILYTIRQTQTNIDVSVWRVEGGREEGNSVSCRRFRAHLSGRSLTSLPAFIYARSTRSVVFWRWEWRDKWARALSDFLQITPQLSDSSI
jgi:hypothetical protein